MPSKLYGQYMGTILFSPQPNKVKFGTISKKKTMAQKSNFLKAAGHVRTPVFLFTFYN